MKINISHPVKELTWIMIYELEKEGKNVDIDFNQLIKDLGFSYISVNDPNYQIKMFKLHLYIFQRTN